MFCQTIKKTQRSNIMAPVWQNSTQHTSGRRLGMCLQDKVVLITGAGSGIGASAAIAFAKEGSKVALADKDENKMKRVAEYCEQKFSVNTLKIKADLTKDEQIPPMICRTAQKFGKLDVVVNNVGILAFGSILNEDLVEQCDRALKSNVRAFIFITLMATPYLMKTKGNIINISSILGSTYVGNADYMPFSISKACLDNFTYGAALELANVGIRVNCVCPGPTRPDIFSRCGVKEKEKSVYKIDTVSEPEEVADLIVYLASAKAKSITGVKYCIDRGIMVTI